MQEKARILIIDDDERSCKDLSLILEQSGYETKRVPDGETALAEAGMQSFKLALIEMTLPGNAGVSLIEPLQQLIPDIVVVMMASHVSVESMAQSFSQGAINFVAKPIEPGKLLETVRDALEKQAFRSKKRRTEMALRESEARWRSLTQTSPDHIVTVDKDLKIQFANYAAPGLTVQDLIGIPLYTFVEESRQAEIKTLLEGVLENGKNTSYETTYFPPDGSLIYYESRVTPSRLEEGGEIIGLTISARDITKRKLAEKSLLASEERFRMMFENMSSGVAVYEALGNGEDFVFKDFNRAAQQIEQVSRDDLIGKPVSQVFPGVVEFGLLDVFQRVWRTGQPEHHPISFYKDSRITGWRENYVYKLPSGEIVAIYDDITERKRTEQALWESNEMLSLFLKYSPIHAYIKEVTPNESRVLKASENFTDMIGVPGSQMAGKTMEELFPPEFAEKITNNDWSVVSGGEVLVLDEDLNGRNYITYKFPITLKDRKLLAGYTVEITHQKRAENELKQKTEEITHLYQQAERRLKNLQALHSIDLAIAGSFDLRITLDIFLEQVISQLEVDAADVLLLDPYLQTLSYAIGQGFRTPRGYPSDQQPGLGHPGRAVLEQRPIYISDLRQGQTGSLRSPQLGLEGFIFYAAIPLIAKGKVQGVLEIFNRSPLQPDSEWYDFLGTLAGQGAVAIDNANLFTDLQKANIEMAIAYDSTLEGWAKALELRDMETEGHSQRVMEWTLRLAQSLQISEKELVHVRRGAQLHDIGKMGIPDAILQKPGPLDEAEWQIMRQHPVYAYEWLSPINYLRPALDIPYCHHEHWDGNGYPRGLKSEQIPLAARIFAVVDVWDALRSDRPYRQAWPEARVRAYLREQSGTQFDPQVVEHFLRMADD